MLNVLFVLLTFDLMVWLRRNIEMRKIWCKIKKAQGLNWNYVFVLAKYVIAIMIAYLP